MGPRDTRRSGSPLRAPYNAGTVSRSALSAVLPLSTQVALAIGLVQAAEAAARAVDARGRRGPGRRRGPDEQNGSQGASEASVRFSSSPGLFGLPCPPRPERPDSPLPSSPQAASTRRPAPRSF